MSSVFKLIPGDDRMTTFPVARPQLFKYYETARDRFWTPGEISTSVDVLHFETKLSPGMQRFVKHVLAFFAASDGIVNLNLAERFRREVPMQDAAYFYNFQIAMEDIHAHTYSILLDDIVPNKEERDRLINASQTMPIIKKMSEYMHNCISSDAPFAERLLRMACVEGIFFTGCFCAIYWLRNQGLMPALGFSNDLIAGDEALHTYFALTLYTMIEPEHKLGRGHIAKIFAEAVDLANEFFVDALPEGMAEMNADLMASYIKCQADNLVTLIGVDVIYDTTHDFHFMDQQNLTHRTNFFEGRSAQYSKVQEADPGDHTIATDF